MPKKKFRSQVALENTKTIIGNLHTSMGGLAISQVWWKMQLE